MLRVVWWLLIAWATNAAIFAGLNTMGPSSSAGVLGELLFYLVLYAVVSAHVRSHFQASWAELVPIRRMAPGLLVPVVLSSLGALVLSYQGLALCRALNVLPPEAFELASRSTQGGGPSGTSPTLLQALLFVAVVPAVFEEAISRGLVLHSLALNMSQRRAILISAVFFAAMHGAIERMPGMFLAGLLYGWMYVRTGSLLPGMIAHALHNATIVILWQSNSLPGLPNSWIPADRYGLLPTWLIVSALVATVAGALKIQNTAGWHDYPDAKPPEPVNESRDRAA